jgi:hypothetical protein
MRNPGLIILCVSAVPEETCLTIEYQSIAIFSLQGGSFSKLNLPFSFTSLPPFCHPLSVKIPVSKTIYAIIAQPV